MFPYVSIEFSNNMPRFNSLDEKKAHYRAYMKEYRATHPEYRKKHDAEAKLWRSKNHPERRQRINSYKDKPCMDCGVQYPSYVMEFDHVRGIKKRGVGEMLHYSHQTLLAEVNKCDVVCANCHRSRTELRRMSC